MHRAVAAAVLALFSVPHAGVAQGPDPASSAAALRAHVAFLADDLLEGRKAGTRGYDLAARYVATQFELVGLQAPPTGWYQQVPLVAAKHATGQSATLAIGDRVFPHKSDVYIGSSVLASSVDVTAPVVFAGYCLDSPEAGIDDYAGLDVTGRIVACLTGFPKGMRSDIGAHLASRRSLMAQERGAIGLLSIPTRQSARIYPWARLLESADEPLTAWVQRDGVPYRQSPGIRAAATLNTPAAEALLAGAPRTLDAILDEADREGGRPKGFPLQHAVRFSAQMQMERLASPNVLGFLPGSDAALAKEVVVLLAHLDHIGTHATPQGPKMHPGALDNAAGVAALLEVARAMAQSPQRPKRSVLFAAVTAEESGLLGSHYLARNPAIPGTQAVAVVCLDAPILLYDFTDVIAFGEEHSTLGAAVARAAASAGVKSSPDPMPEQGIFTRSDHYSFVKEGVPGVFLVTGFANGGQKAFAEYLQKHYHRPSDDLKLPIDWNAAARFARINHLILRDVADAPQRPLWYGDSLFSKTYAPRDAKATR